VCYRYTSRKAFPGRGKLDGENHIVEKHSAGYHSIQNELNTLFERFKAAASQVLIVPKSSRKPTKIALADIIQLARSAFCPVPVPSRLKNTAFSSRLNTRHWSREG
jgi:hypothetical protein